MEIELSGVQFGLKPNVWFEITSMILDQNCTTRSPITPLLHPFWNHKVQSLGHKSLSLYKCFVDPAVSWFVESCKSCFSFSCKLIGFFKQAIGCILAKLPYWLIKRCDLKQKWCDSWINRNNESQSDYKDHQWFQNGYKWGQI